MRPIFIKKHEWDFANMVPIAITKHKMTFRNLNVLVISGQIRWKKPGETPQINNYFLGSKTIGFSERFLKQNGIVRWWDFKPLKS